MPVCGAVSGPWPPTGRARIDLKRISGLCEMCFGARGAIDGIDGLVRGSRAGFSAAQNGHRCGSSSLSMRPVTSMRSSFPMRLASWAAMPMELSAYFGSVLSGCPRCGNVLSLRRGCSGSTRISSDFARLLQCFIWSALRVLVQVS